MAQSPLTWVDWVGLTIFLAISAGIVYLIILIPAEVEKVAKRATESQADKKISFSTTGVKVKTDKRMNFEDATYGMVKGSRDMAKRIKETKAATFKKGEVAPAGSAAASAGVPVAPK